MYVDFSPIHVVNLLAIVALAGLTVWAIASNLANRTIRTGEKIAWSILLLVPVVGLLTWAITRAVRSGRRHGD